MAKKRQLHDDLSANAFAITVMLFAVVFIMFEFFMLLLVAPYWV